MCPADVYPLGDVENDSKNDERIWTYMKIIEKYDLQMFTIPLQKTVIFHFSRWNHPFTWRSTAPPSVPSGTGCREPKSARYFILSSKASVPGSDGTNSKPKSPSHRKVGHLENPRNMLQKISSILETPWHCSIFSGGTINQTETWLDFSKNNHSHGYKTYGKHNQHLDIISDIWIISYYNILWDPDVNTTSAS